MNKLVLSVLLLLAFTPLAMAFGTQKTVLGNDRYEVLDELEISGHTYNDVSVNYKLEVTNVNDRVDIKDGYFKVYGKEDGKAYRIEIKDIKILTKQGSNSAREFIVVEGKHILLTLVEGSDVYYDNYYDESSFDLNVEATVITSFDERTIEKTHLRLVYENGVLIVTDEKYGEIFSFGEYVETEAFSEKASPKTSENEAASLLDRAKETLKRLCVSC